VCSQLTSFKPRALQSHASSSGFHIPWHWDFRFTLLSWTSKCSRYTGFILFSTFNACLPILLWVGKSCGYIVGLLLRVFIIDRYWCHRRASPRKRGTPDSCCVHLMSANPLRNPLHCKQIHGKNIWVFVHSYHISRTYKFRKRVVISDYRFLNALVSVLNPY
jgi:hypothetical protein